MHQELALDIRTDPFGNSYLYFPFMTVSDVHLGTKHSRAKRLSHMLDHTISDDFYLVGDIVDGEHMHKKKKWSFDPWHRQVVGHVCRKAASGTNVTYIPGNHDQGIRHNKTECDGKRHLHRNLCGKSIYGIHVEEMAFYGDPKGRILKLIHGDQYDPTLASCGGLGDAALELMAHVDTAFQLLPRCSHISLAAKGKRATKKIVDKFWSIGKNIEKDVDGNPHVDAIVFGHSHISEIRRTKAGKLVLNDGCCTEHVEALVQDRNGNFAIIEWHQEYLKISEEIRNGNGQFKIKKRYLSWKELGLDSFNEPQRMIEDKYTERADRLIRLFYRMWPPKERKRAKMAGQFARAAEEGTLGLPDRTKRQFYKEWSKKKYRRVKKMAEEMREVGEIAQSTGYLPLPNPGRTRRWVEAAARYSLPERKIA